MVGGVSSDGADKGAKQETEQPQKPDAAEKEQIANKPVHR